MDESRIFYSPYESPCLVTGKIDFSPAMCRSKAFSSVRHIKLELLRVAQHTGQSASCTAGISQFDLWKGKISFLRHAVQKEYVTDSAFCAGCSVAQLAKLAKLMWPGE